MKFLHKVWGKWCERVDKHNEKVDWEDYWQPYDIFWGLVFGLLAGALEFLRTFNLRVAFYWFIVVSIIGSIYLAINWRINE